MDTPAYDAAWRVDESELAANATPADKLRFALRYAVLAPSSHNTQPWRFIVDGETVTLNADRLRALPVADPCDRELIISLNQPIEVETLRERLRATLKIDGAPQLLLRMGRGPRIAHAPRRSFDDVVS